MLFKLLLVICIIHNALPNPYKHKEIHKQNFNGQFHEQNKIRPYKNHINEQSADLSSESRRLFDWIKTMLHKNEPNAPNAKVTPTYEEVTNEKIRFRQIERNLTETLTKLSIVLNQILNIVKYSRTSHFNELREYLPTNVIGSRRRNIRYRRNLNISNTGASKLHKDSGNALEELSNLNNKSHENHIKVDVRNSGNVEQENSENDNLNNNKMQTENKIPSNTGQETMHNLKHGIQITNIDEEVKRNIQETRVKRETTEAKKDVTKHYVDNKAEKKNNSNIKDEVKEATTVADVPKSGRRSMSPIQLATHDEVKNRLFQYIDEAFSEISKKIDSLKPTKLMFARDVSYQVGYIISNIDTLQVNIHNMKIDMDRNRYIWEDKKILNLYDTVKLSNQAVSNLLEILKNYINSGLH